jgi:hypothetical protein
MITQKDLFEIYSIENLGTRPQKVLQPWTRLRIASSLLGHTSFRFSKTSRPALVPFAIDTGSHICGLKGSGREANTHLNRVPSLRTIGAVPSLPDVPSRHVQGQPYLF